MNPATRITPEALAAAARVGADLSAAVRDRAGRIAGREGRAVVTEGDVERAISSMIEPDDNAIGSAATGAAKAYDGPEAKWGRDHMRRWREEIAKYLPQVRARSFMGPEPTIRWLFRNVDIKPEAATLADQLKRIEAEMPEGEAKSRARIEAMFPKLRGDGGEGRGEDDDCTNQE